MAIPANELRKDFGPFKSLTGRGGKDKAPAVAIAAGSCPNGKVEPELLAGGPSGSSGQSSAPPGMTNLFSLVERFTFRPSPTVTELDSPNPPSTLPQEIQYWAGIIMRHVCRKDENRGGTRQCVNSEYLSRLVFLFSG